MSLTEVPTISEKDISDIYGEKVSFEIFKKGVLADYHLAYLSREISLISRREVLTGKAKFGIIGDGKEIPQIALTKVFQKGDWRSGYYRDQTIMLALNTATPEALYAQLYADPDPKNEPHSAGRQMNAHFSTHSLDENGEWNNLMDIYNTSPDISCTSGQMPRALGLALASQKFKNIEVLQSLKQFSNKGREVTFVTIGDASTSEGHFWETVNAAGVLKVPMAIFIWDDGYGISVPTKYQTTKGSISEILEGFRVNEKGEGLDIYVENGWDYPALCKTIRKGIEKVRKTHIPAIFHIKEVTQPQGHSTSGSHERYKSKERLEWEKEYDCNIKMKEWILSRRIASEIELQEIEKEAVKEAREAKKRAWKDFTGPILNGMKHTTAIYDKLIYELSNDELKKVVSQAKQSLATTLYPTHKDISKSMRNVLSILRNEALPSKEELIRFNREYIKIKERSYTSYLYSESKFSPLNVEAIAPKYSENSPMINGSEILNKCFDAAFEREPKLLAFGEDVGYLGGVNQGMAGLQAKYGEDRVFDTGIREATIIGQGIGLALRGLKPIAEIQYLDYLMFGLQTMSDDLATLHYRSAGRQKAPLIVRTRGHRLEGIWHTGSPLGMMINSLRGLHILVPRNMVQAAGFYNTLLQSDDPAIVIEVLNAYRLKERLPDNIGEFTLPLGIPEILRAGKDITICTYGACCRIVMEAAEKLYDKAGIDCEVIDVQTLLPFDRHHHIVKSLQKTNRILLIDEDLPGGATAFMMREILEVQKGYQYLDSAPATLTAKANRPPFGSDGDYYVKPNVEDVFEAAYNIMNEFDPTRFQEYL